MKIKTALLIATMIVLSSCATHYKTSYNEESSDNIPQETDIKNEEVEYGYISADWYVYESVGELEKKCGSILSGTVTNISFQAFDTNAEKYGVNIFLYTIYDVDVITSYKGSDAETVRFRMLGGLEGKMIEEQLAALNDGARRVIPIMNGMPEIEVGETYLFMLSEYEDAMPTLVNVTQGAFNLREPLLKDLHSLVSPKQIISYFGEDKWAEFQKNGIALE